MSSETGRHVMGRDATGATTRFRYLAVDSSGQMLTSPGTASFDGPAADFISRVVSAAAAELYKLSGKSTASAVRYVHVFNATSLPANGTAPFLRPTELGPGEEFAEVYNGIAFDTGIVIGSSSTRDTLTITAAADLWCDTEYRT